jgi:fructoselysine 6-kinase
MRSFELATVGDNCIDYISGAANFSLVGGNAVNVAVQLSALGRQCAYFGAVGNDAAGARIIKVLAAKGVIVDFVRVVEGTTAYTKVELDSGNDRKFISEEFGVVKDYRTDLRDVAALATARHVHIGWLNDGGALRQTLSQRGVSISQDISVNAEPRNRDVGGLTVAFASADGSDDEVRRMAACLVSRGAKLAVITRGNKGSIVTDGTQFFMIDAIKIKPVDTTGAGDAFIAGFLDAFLKERPLDECLINGRKTATAACLHLGGFPQELVQRL